jgi:hypothetical protein
VRHIGADALPFWYGAWRKAFSHSMEVGSGLGNSRSSRSVIVTRMSADVAGPSAFQR